jgi:NAD(P)-dependent dehydrogenase (short-subunit alcohol dehydrogenase family)
VPVSYPGAGRLRGRIAIVSGGAGGMGRAITSLFVAEGASVMVADLPESEGKAVAQSLGPTADFTPLDVRDPDQWKATAEGCRVRFGAPADVLVHAAGVMVLGSIDDCSPDDVERAFRVNVLGTVHAIQTVAPAMRKARKGSIVVITSMAGVTFGCAGMAPYAASKAGMGALVKCAALDFAGSGIRINQVVPGQIDTPMSRSVGVPESVFDRMPIPRIGQPRDIAQAALFLASDESGFVTGTELLVDGGMEAGPVIG